MRKAEANLDLFWETVDLHFQKETKKTLQQAYHHLFSEQRTLERTPEWVEQSTVQKSQKWRSKEMDEDAADFLKQLGLEPETPSPVLQPQKVKVKTRGKKNTVPASGIAGTPSEPSEQTLGNDKLLEQSPIPTPTTPPPNIDIPAIPQPTSANQTSLSPILLRPKDYKVFSTLFFAPNQSDQPGEIAWKDFLSAMAGTGFEIEKLYGSIWQFTPPPSVLKPGIQFHEPHPQGKIPFRNARRIGRRLLKTYG